MRAFVSLLLIPFEYNSVIPGWVRVTLAQRLALAKRSLDSFFFSDFDFRGTLMIEATIWLRIFRITTSLLSRAEMSSLVGFLSFGTGWDLSDKDNGLRQRDGEEISKRLVRDW